jgi:DNA polymerase-3 subunit beta
MKIQCSKADILPHIQQVQSIVEQKTTLHILSNVHLQAKDNRLIFSATDLELGIRSSCIVEMHTPGATTIPARKLFEIIRNLPDKPIHIEVENDVMKIQCERSSYRVFGLPASNFPELPDFSEAPVWEFSQKLLKDMIRHTSFAISRDESRYVLNGIYMVFTPHEILGVATDGRRLSTSKHDGSKYDGIRLKEMKVDFIIPSKTVNELTKLLSEEGSMKIFHKTNQVCFEMGSTTLITKLIEGNFPDFSSVIPKSSTEAVIFDHKNFSEAISRIAILISEKSTSIKLAFTPGKCEITINSPNVGDGREELEVEYKGKEFAIAFNPYYLLDILKCVKTETVTLELSNATSPGVVRQGSEFLSVIMPMRLTD